MTYASTPRLFGESFRVRKDDRNIKIALNDRLDNKRLSCVLKQDGGKVIDMFNTTTTNSVTYTMKEDIFNIGPQIYKLYCAVWENDATGASSPIASIYNFLIVMGK